LLLTFLPRLTARPSRIAWRVMVPMQTVQPCRGVDSERE
jgi:hypothetical protein